MSGVLRKWYLTVENDTVMMTAYGKLTKSITSQELSKLLDFPSVSTKQINSLCSLSRMLCESKIIKQSLEEQNKQSFIVALNNYPEKSIWLIRANDKNRKIFKVSYKKRL